MTIFFIGNRSAMKSVLYKLRAVPVFMLAALGLALGHGYQAHAQSSGIGGTSGIYLPAIRTNSTTLLSPGSAWSYYAGQSGATAMPQHPRIIELARALNHDPEAIYFYVKNNVKFEARFGLQKGALGASRGLTGTAFDQAHLLAELLWASGQSSARIAVGDITVAGSEFTSWFGISNAYLACRTLADGGIPASVNGASSCAGLAGNVSSVTMLHAWVQYDGNDLDPAFKELDVTAPLDIAGIAGVTGSGFHSTATNARSNTGTTVDGVNRTAMHTSLDAGAKTLLAYINTNNPFSSTEDVFGGRELRTEAHVPLADIVNSQSLAAPRGTYGQNQVPDVFRTKITIGWIADGVTYFADQIYGDRLTLMNYNTGCETSISCSPTANEIRLSRGHTSVDQAFHSAHNNRPEDVLADQYFEGVISGAVISIDMPYAASTADGAGKYQDDQIYKKLDGSAVNELFIFLGDTTQDEYVAYERQAREWAPRYWERYEANPPSDCAEFSQVSGSGFEAQDISECLLNTFYAPVGGLYGGDDSNYFVDEMQVDRDYLVRQWGVGLTKLKDALNQISTTEMITHYSVGISGGGVKSLSFDVETRLSVNDASDSNTNISAAVSTLSAFAANLELSTIDIHHRASSFKSNENSSAVRFLSAGNERQRVNNSNYNRNLFDVSVSEAVFVRMEEYLSDGYSLLVNYAPTWSSPIVVYDPTDMSTAFTTSFGQRKGAETAITSGSNHMPQGSPDFFANKLAIERGAKADVTLSSGDLRFSDGGDISVGNGGYPYSLSFNRTYSSNSVTEGPLGRSWTHNLDIKAHLGGSLMEWMGETNPKRAAVFYTSLAAAYEANRLGNQVEDLFIASVAAEWWSIGADSNTLSISGGLGGEQFVKLADGTWNAGNRSNATINFSGELTVQFQQTNSIPFTYYPGDGSKVTFDQVYGSDLEFLASLAARSGDDQSLYQADSIQSFAQIKTHEFPTGVTVTYTYNQRTGVLKSISNNLGRQLSFASLPGALCHGLVRGMSGGGSTSAGSGTNGGTMATVTTTFDGAGGIKVDVGGVEETQGSGFHGGFASYSFPTVFGFDLGSIPHLEGLGVDIVAECNGQTNSDPFDWRSMRSVSNGTDTVTFTTEHVGNRRGFGPHRQSRSHTQVNHPAHGNLVGRYEYDPDTMKLVGYFEPLDQVTPFLTIDYMTGESQSGRTSKVTDKSGHVTEYGVMPRVGHKKQLGLSEPITEIEFFDTDNNLYLMVDPVGRKKTVAYDTIGRKIREVNPEGNAVETNYDIWQNVIEIRQISKDGSQTLTANASFAPVTTNKAVAYNLSASQTDAHGNVTNFDYNLSGQLASITQAEVDTTGNGVADTNPLSSFQYDTLGFGRLTSATTATGIVTEATYSSANGNLTALSVDPGGEAITSSFTYDAVGNQISINGPLPVTGGRDDIVTTFYDAFRRPVTVFQGQIPVSAAGNFIGAAEAADIIAFSQTVYDANDRPVLASVYAREYNTLGSVTERDSQSTITSYTLSGQVESTISPDGAETTSSYDELGRVDMVTDPVGRKTKTVYDALGRIVSLYRGWQSPSQILYQHYTYTVSGQVASVMDANCNVTTYHYDGFNRLAATYFPPKGTAIQHVEPGVEPDRCLIPANQNNPAAYAGGAHLYADREEYDYDKNSNLLVKRTRNGDHILSGYDALSRVTSKTTYLEGSWSRSTQLLTGGTEQNRIDYTYRLDGSDNTITQTGGSAAGVNIPNVTLSYGYDTAGRQTSETVTNGAITRMVAVELDAVGNRTKLIHPGSSFAVDLGYDYLGRMQGLTVDGTGTNDNVSYAYDGFNRRTSATITGAGGDTAVTSYKYKQDSALQRIKHDFMPGPHPVTAQTTDFDISFNFGYNPANQVTARRVSNDLFMHSPLAETLLDYTANGLNQYDSVDTLNTSTGEVLSTQALGYDANASLTSDGVWTYSYDAENRLVKAAKSGSDISYEYGPKGRRLASTSSTAGRTEYVYEGDEPIEDYTGAGTLLRRYVNGASVDERLVYLEYDGAGTETTRSYYHADHQGSIIAMSKSGDQSVSDIYTYDAYGNMGEGQGGGQPFRYTGRRWDNDTGLYYYRARYYSAKLGRFLQTDPIGYEDNMNLYGYTANDPINNTDPSGNTTLTLKGKIGVKIGSILANMVFAGKGISASGLEGSGGIAISFPVPFFDEDAIFDVGVIASGALTDVSAGDGSSLPSAPGAKGGLDVGLQFKGSVSDLRGPSTKVRVQSNIGKKLSNTIVDGVLKALPAGKVKDFLNGSFRKAANAFAGLTVSAGASFDEAGNIEGFEVGASKGFNTGAGADIEETAVCSLRSGCSDK